MTPYLSGLLLICTFIGSSRAGQWRYSGPTGPDSWHELFPSACSGEEQSPIDIQPEMTMFDPDLKDFAIWYDPPKPGSRMYVKNNGHAIQVDTVGDFYVTNGGLNNVYKTSQFHFHWGSQDHVGSEHLLDSVAYPIEMHIVNYNSDRFNDIAEAVVEKGGLAVLGVLFEVQEEVNPAFEPIIAALQQVKDPEEGNSLEIEPLSLRSLLPNDISKYYRYNGSLTTPGCFETVTWTVFHEKQKISFGQLLKFRRVLQHRHHKHHKKHHKRSMRRRVERQAEENAEAVLNEMGIKHDNVQKGELMSSLVNQKNQEATSTDVTSSHMTNTHGSKSDATVLALKSSDATQDQPTAMAQTDVTHEETKDVISDPDMTKVSVDEEIAKQAEENMKEYTETLLETPTDTHSTAEEPTVVTNLDSQPKEETGEEWVQENLVDNFRPPQPLNNRMVHRSFKLKDIYEAKPKYEVVNEPQPPKQNAIGEVYSKKNPGNSGHQAQFTFYSLILVFIISFL
ncbi:carbonic anhydrase 6 [Patella vulgata]|uniref:carbonic anhydrase 6 n=1 Tax=Patella vulgata TaxID=6465 RepID=UPI00218013B7|nr:carbonic anhydrase 6 [Patella vulgata]